jgi:hypothetical protein
MCVGATFVDVSVSLRIAPGDFSPSMQTAFSQALADACGTAYERVTVVRTAGVGRRQNTSSSGSATANVVLVDASVAEESPADAASLSERLNGPALNVQLQRRGLPSGTLLSVEVRKDGQVSSSSAGLILGLAIAGGAVLLLVVGGLVLSHTMRDSSSPEERQLRYALMVLRQQLSITAQDGYVLSSETVPWGWRGREVVHIQRSHAEAAARLCLFQDFDVNQFDAFCLCLEGDRPSAKHKTSVRTLHSHANPSAAAQEGDAEGPYKKISDILLLVATALIRPDVCNNGGADIGKVTSLFVHKRSGLRALHGSSASVKPDDNAGDCPLPLEMRNRFLMNRVRKVRMWQDGGHSLFRKLQVCACNSCDTRRICKFACVPSRSIARKHSHAST